MHVTPVLLKDGYKVGHKFQYPDDTTLVYSNFTPRGARVEGAPGVIAFGMQYFVEEYLIRQFRDGFFEVPRERVMAQYKRRINNYLGPDAITFDHIEALWNLGYLPLKMKAVPEGTLVPFRVPMLTICNTKPEFFWLTNMLETLLSNMIWHPTTSATTAFLYRKNFERFAEETGANKEFIPWQGHDFSFRGLAGVESAELSGAAHLLSFTGTDTIPAIDLLEQYYGADSDTELVGGSVPATEHSVMCMGEQVSERETFRRLLVDTYPAGILSVVSDTWDFWKVMTEYVPSLHAEIMAREGKLVIRPDSGNPTDIICGVPEEYHGVSTEAQRKGAIELLWDEFGGTINHKGFKELDPHVGLIYGDSITLERQVEILERLKEKGFASSNVVMGIGSFTYQYVTRDTYGWAMKATYGETRSRGGIEIFKNPMTDSGTKKSAKGLLRVDEEVDGTLTLAQGVTWAEEGGGLLQTIFQDGEARNIQTLAEVRQRVESYL